MLLCIFNLYPIGVSGRERVKVNGTQRKEGTNNDWEWMREALSPGPGL